MRVCRSGRLDTWRDAILGHLPLQVMVPWGKRPGMTHLILPARRKCKSGTKYPFIHSR